MKNFGVRNDEVRRIIKTSRRHVLNIYSDNNAYANLFKTDFG